MKKIIFHILIVIATLSLTASYSHAVSFSSSGVRFNKKVKTMKQIKKQNIVSQSLDFSCGAAGLSTLLNYYLNDNISEQEIINSILNTTPLEKIIARRGFSLLDLKKFAQAKGYKVTGYKMDWKFLKELDKPVLVPIKFKNYHHFVVIKGVISDRVFIADPAVGNMTVKKNKFEKMWVNNIGLLIERPEGNSSQDYALRVEQKDVLLWEFNKMEKMADRSLIQTAIHPNEY